MEITVLNNFQPQWGVSRHFHLWKITSIHQIDQMQSKEFSNRNRKKELFGIPNRKKKTKENAVFQFVRTATEEKKKKEAKRFCESVYDWLVRRFRVKWFVEDGF